ncbi:MAG: twin-arginine translocation signal domain-containing protein, partial [Acidiferrobacterales bacterium]
MDKQVTRRRFLKQMGVTVGAAGLGAAGVGATGYFAGPRAARAAMKPKGRIPNKPLKAGHITFQ